VLFLGWRISVGIPEKLRNAERELVAMAGRYGLDVRYGEIRIHLLRLLVTIDNVVVRDALADLPIANAGAVDVSISPLRILSGETPVSRVRARNFRVEAGERNRALYERLSSPGGEPRGTLPEILLVDGVLALGPLGPIRGLTADVREFRVRETRFLGKRMTLSFAKVAGSVDIPGERAAVWPYPSLDADLLYKDRVLKIRRARAWGESASVRISGSLDTKLRTLDGKASGEADLARWIASGAPGTAYVKDVVRQGKLEFSASVAGRPDDPVGTAKVTLREGNVKGAAATEGEAELSLTGRIVRLDRARGKVWGGALEASGRYAIDSGRSEGKASLRRFSLAAVPWDDAGSPVRLSGTADLAATVSGAPGRWKGEVTVSLPEGVVAPASGDRAEAVIRIPVSLEVAGSVANGEDVRLESFHLSAGRAEIRGEGDLSLARRSVDLRGSGAVPTGKAAEYGWAYPLSWDKAAVEWELSGPMNRPRAKFSLTTASVAVRSLPPMPLTVKAEGVAGETLHFVADFPLPSMKVTAVGTVTAPLERSKARADFSVSLREIDLADSGRWMAAVVSSLGKDPASFKRYFEEVEGSGDADAHVSVSAADFTASGSFRSSKVSVRRIALRAVKAEGDVRAGLWTARAEGSFGGGSARVSASGGNGRGSELSGDLAAVEIAQVVALAKRDDLKRVRGLVAARFRATEGPLGWEVASFSADSKELSAGEVHFAGVRAAGSLGTASGTLSVRVDSPRVELSADFQRGGGRPAKFSLSAPGVPTSFLLAAAGRSDIPSGGTWSFDASGVLRLEDFRNGRPPTPESFPALSVSVRAREPSFGEVRFLEGQVSGRRQGDALAGELVTRNPDTRLAWTVALREPFGFRLEGPFSIGEVSDAPRDEKRRFLLRGRAEIQGALRAVDRTTGVVRVESLAYREGGLDLSGKDLSARLDPEGVRWTGGTLQAAGSPVRVSGKVSWKGDLDLRLEGKVPAGIIRLAVPDVFDRLDGAVTVEARVTGNRSDPTIVGTGHLEGGTLSFLGYAQQFEGLRADAVISREKIVFERFEGRSGGGYIDGWGEVPLRMDAGQRMYFSVDFMDLRYPYPDEFRPVIQGHAELFGPVDDLMVTGDVEVQSAKYTKTLRPEKALVDFGKRLADVTARRERSAFRVRLDINAIADGTIRIKNNLADAEAKGEFKVVGDSSRVIILGSFDVTEGYVEFRGNRYELKRAMVDFQDPRNNNPRIDGRAETRKGNVNVTVTVTGTLEKYEVDMFSDPPLGKNDIVALLSLGVTTQALAGQEGTVGSAAAASLALGPYKGGVEEGIRGAVGLDRFAIEPGFSTTTKTIEPRFIVGKSFGERATVAVSTSVGTTAESSATAEVKLRENVYLQGAWESATTTKEGDLGADLKFRYRYRDWKDFLRGTE